MLNSTSLSPVGVFDSGLGGISVLAELARVMPCEDFIYYGDSANAPYGEKSVSEVRQCAFDVVEKLLGMGVKAIVIACNTATSAAVGPLRDTYPTLPIIGMEPAVKPAALSDKHHPTVLVMATPLTIRETRLRTLIDKYRDRADFIDAPCHGLVELVERGIIDGDEMETLLCSIFDSCVGSRHIDAAVLGCTHYIHARDAIARVLRARSSSEVAIFDGAHGTALETLHRLEENHLLRSCEPDSEKCGRITVLNSSENQRALELSLRLLDLARSRKDTI